MRKVVNGLIYDTDKMEYLFRAVYEGEVRLEFYKARNGKYIQYKPQFKTMEIVKYEWIMYIAERLLSADEYVSIFGQVKEA